MSISMDPITRRKLILVKQLYQQAEKQSNLQHSISIRIMSVIGFDLAIETLLKVIVGVLDQRKQPNEGFPGLLDQCDDLLSKQGLPLLPHRAQVLHVHSIRNDAQHKAKYPNQTDISDCRTYVRDFCIEVICNIWGVSFGEISPLEWIDDTTLRELLELSWADIQAQNYKKGLTLAKFAFDRASASILDFLPQGADGLYDGQVPELARNTVKYVNAVLKNIENTAKHFAAMMSTGISIVDYKQFKKATPTMCFNYSSSVQAPADVRVRVDVQWRGNEPDEETASWVHAFVVDSVVSWQTLGLAPRIPNEDSKKQAQILIKWDENQVKMIGP